MTTDLEKLISGALFDFGAFLTTREQSVTIGADQNSGPMVSLIQEFAESRNLDLKDADVTGWQGVI